MREVLDLKFLPDDKQLPVAKLARLFLQSGVIHKADLIVFELDLEAHKEIKSEKEEAKTQFHDMKQFPTAFQITLKSSETEKKLAPANGYLFEPVTRILLNAAEIPYWTKGEASAELETSNPSSKWMIESKDLTQRIQLRRIHMV